MFLSYLKFIKKLFIHKYYILIFGIKLRAPIFNLIIHDWSKFLPCEHLFWFHRQIDTSINKYDFGWIHHYNVNKHHWQYWILYEDSGKIRTLDIPDKYIREMVSDWAASGLSKTGKLEVKKWYNKNKKKIFISIKTRKRVEEFLNKHF